MKKIMFFTDHYSKHIFEIDTDYPETQQQAYLNILEIENNSIKFSLLEEQSVKDREQPPGISEEIILGLPDSFEKDELIEKWNSYRLRVYNQNEIINNYKIAIRALETNDGDLAKIACDFFYREDIELENVHVPEKTVKYQRLDLKSKFIMTKQVSDYLDDINANHMKVSKSRGQTYLPPNILGFTENGDIVVEFNSPRSKKIRLIQIEDQIVSVPFLN